MTNTLILTLLVRLFLPNVLGYSPRISVCVVPPLKINSHHYSSMREHSRQIFGIRLLSEFSENKGMCGSAFKNQFSQLFVNLCENARDEYSVFAYSPLFSKNWRMWGSPLHFLPGRADLRYLNRVQHFSIKYILGCVYLYRCIYLAWEWTLCTFPSKIFT